jgi:hypothetical protein
MHDRSPLRRGRYVTIRPLHPTDYDRLYEIAMLSDAGSRRAEGGVAEGRVSLEPVVVGPPSETLGVVRR